MKQLDTAKITAAKKHHDDTVAARKTAMDKSYKTALAAKHKHK